MAKGPLTPTGEVELVEDLLRLVGEDPHREGLRETPMRFIKAWKFWTSGYGQDPASVLKTFSDGAERYDEMVFQGAIATWSICEHHMAPFFGVAHIGYIPNGKVVGLSKLIRLVEIYSRRLQVQERLTQQIANALNDHLQPNAVGVVMRCRHSCIESRGVQKAGSMTYTSCLLGLFKEPGDARAEFLKFVDRADTLETNR